MAFLIDEEYLEDYTSVRIQKNAKDIKVALQVVTIVYLQPLLGLPLYERLEALQGQSLSPEQAQLLAHVRYYAALLVEREMMLNLITISNKGATQEETSASLEVVKLKRQDSDAKASHVRQLIIGYLDSHRTDFPEYYPAGSGKTSPAGGFPGGLVVDPLERKKYYQ